MTASDLELLRQFARENSQDAFAEIVRRHLNLVYSAALRQVRSPQLAEEIAQSVFTDLARNTVPLCGMKPDTILTAWLYAVTRRTAIDTIRKESRRQLREHIAVEMNDMNATSADWTQIEPLLDDAMAALDETDRRAVLLRYFENKSLREVGEALDASEDAAQKRVSRAVERLREFFSKRTVTIGTSGLTILISTNAVQAAPAGLAVTISAAALAGTTVSTSTAIAATKAIAMTTLQKALITATLAVVAGAGIYEAQQASTLRQQNQTLQQQQAPLVEQIGQLQRQRDVAMNQLAGLLAENGQLKSNSNETELLKLRGEVGVLRTLLTGSAANANASSNGLAIMMSSPAMKEYMHQQTLKFVASGYSDLIGGLNLTAEQRDKFIKIVGEAGFKVAEAFSTQNQAGFEQARSGIKEDLESQLKSLLGETGLERFNEFNKEVPARSTLDLLNDELGSNPITDAQRTSLLQIIKAEPYNLTHGILGEVDGAFLGSPEDVADYLQQVADSNRRILLQAGGILNQDQLAALNTVLTNGIHTRKVFGEALVQKH